MTGVHASAPRSVLLARALAAVALLLGAGALLAGPASAHVSLTGTVPAADEQVATAPTEVQLTYSDALLEVGNAVSVTGPSGALTLEPVQVADRTLVQPLPADLPPGAYTVQLARGVRRRPPDRGVLLVHVHRAGAHERHDRAQHDHQHLGDDERHVRHGI